MLIATEEETVVEEEVVEEEEEEEEEVSEPASTTKPAKKTTSNPTTKPKVTPKRVSKDASVVITPSPLVSTIDTTSKITSGVLSIADLEAFQAGNAPSIAGGSYPIYYDPITTTYFIIDTNNNNVRYNLEIIGKAGKILVTDLDGNEIVPISQTKYSNKNTYDPSIKTIVDYDNSVIKITEMKEPSPKGGIQYQVTVQQQSEILKGDSSVSNQFGSLIAPLFGTGSEGVFNFFVALIGLFIFLIILLLI